MAFLLEDIQENIIYLSKQNIQQICQSSMTDEVLPRE